MRQPISMAVVFGEIKGYFLGIAVFNDFCQRQPLIGLNVDIPFSFEQISHIVASYRQFFQRLFATGIIKYHDGTSSSRKPRTGQHGAHYRVFVVFPGNNDPHINAFASHELWKQRC